MRVYWAFALGLALGCTVSLTDDLFYSCTSNDDCGGGGFVCSAVPGGVGRCCKPSGVEVCDGLDNDCNGQVDEGVGTVETCNGVDDDCNGRIDDGFDFLTDAVNCGRCGNVCAQGQRCLSGLCQKRGEMICSDGLDNDDDQKIDCADEDCNQQLCGSGCQCRALKKAEGNCNNAVDDDGDSKTDCADEDCGGAGCGDGGCFCEAGMKKEANCADTLDNDSDSQTDCADSDCNAVLCGDAGTTTRCSAGSCRCNGGSPVNENSAVLCRDFIDNDCDGLVDCAEASCNLQNCNPDGGGGCQCRSGVRAETNCADRKDNDVDALTDCADSEADGGGNCPIGIACTYLNTSGQVTAGTCAGDKTCK